MQSQRVRIRIQQRDGTCPTPDEECQDWQGQNIPYPRGRDCQVYIVDDDGSETQLKNVHYFNLSCAGRGMPVKMYLELFNPIVDIIVPAEIDTVHTTGGDFLGAERTNLELATPQGGDTTG